MYRQMSIVPAAPGRAATKHSLVGRIALWWGLTVLSALAAGAQQDTTAVDSLLLRQLERALEAPAPAGQTQPRSAVSTNPSMGVIGDMQASYEGSSGRRVDAYFNEAEISLLSAVDPYARADFFLSFARDPSSGEYAAELEEAFVTTTDLPAHLQLKAGKFRMTMGKTNQLHPHALPYIDLPNVLVNYLGDEGLNDAGVSLSWLVPNPFEFFQELTLEVTGGPREHPSFARSSADRYLYLAHLKNFWDLTENATLEAGLTGVTGPNEFGETTTIGGVDLTYKWKPLRLNTYHSFVWQSEALACRTGSDGPDDLQSWGMYTAMTYQLDQRYFLTGRFDYSNLPTSGSYVERAVSATLGWYATEFQKIELEAKHTTGNVHDRFTQAWLRWMFVIGAHGAHAY